MFSILLVLQVLMGIAIIGLVLLQQGKGADMGAAFGAGASGTVFGAAGGGSFFTRATAVLATLFFANSILLSSPLVLEKPDASVSVTQSVPAPAPAPQESDVPMIEGDVAVEQVDVPPSDLPEVAEPPAPAEAGKPTPAAEPVQTDQAPADSGSVPAESDPAPAETQPE